MRIALVSKLLKENKLCQAQNLSYDHIDLICLKLFGINKSIVKKNRFKGELKCKMTQKEVKEGQKTRDSSILFS